jgi:hypothetical protein
MGWTILGFTDLTQNVFKTKKIVADIKYSNGDIGHINVNGKMTIKTLIELAKENGWQILKIWEE